MPTLDRNGTRLMEGMKEAFANAGVNAVVTGFPEVFHVAFGLDATRRATIVIWRA